jgi:NADH-quinone oxidoreductase subunit N
VPGLNEQLISIQKSVSLFAPEITLILGVAVVLIAGLFSREKVNFFIGLSLILFATSLLFIVTKGFSSNAVLFGMLHLDGFSSYLKILLDVSGILTCLMLFDHQHRKYIPEYFALLLSIVLGGHLLLMSNNMVMIFLSLELISICSYILTGYSFDKAGSEGSLKYFLFGSVASAIMLYGFTILYGVTGTLDLSSTVFTNQLIASNKPLVLAASMMVLAGFLYKIAAAPMHPWAPDAYEAAPMTVIAFFSTVPKLAGLGILTKFLLIINLFGQSHYDWQTILGSVTILTLTVGNFSALSQKNPKRLMAYSSIAQSGFLLVSVVAFLPQGIYFMLFYATSFVVMNFLVFIGLNYFEIHGIKTLAAFSGTAKKHLWPSIFLGIGMISLTGLPPTAGFIAKFFAFSAVWQSYEITHKTLLLWIIVFGLLNTVVSLFYYLRIPYFSFLKNGETAPKQNNLTFQNLLAFILVLVILILFFAPGLLMGWINKINFVL